MKPELWIIAANGRKSQDKPVVKLATQEAEKRDWEKRVYRQPPIQDRAGKPYCLLDPDTAKQIYQRAHSARLAVWTTADVWVQLDPTRHRLDPRYLAHLSRLIRYKACYARVSPANLPRAAAAFDDWTSRIECDSERDARVLPLHMFCPSEDVTDLASDDGKLRFGRKHGHPSDRTCENGLHWKPDPARHGQMQGQVAGRILSRGYHWDVSDKHKRTLLTLTQVVQVQPAGHVNVSPNGHVRLGSRSKFVKQKANPGVPPRKK